MPDQTTNSTTEPQTYQNYINGKWTPAHSGNTFTRRNPADTTDIVGNYPESNAEDVEAAAQAARAALPSWRKLSPNDRAAYLTKAADILARRQSEVARALTREEGKTIAEASGETGRGVVILRYYAGEGLRVGGEVIPSVNPNILMWTERVAVGVMGLITPWNFPVAIPLWKAAPALIYGNTVLLKPSELSPHTAQLLAEVFDEAGLPPGVFNLVQGKGAAGQALCENAHVNGISFTGSARTGKSIARACVERGAKYQLEMGGKNPVIVLDDADLNQAVELTVQGAMKSAGEKCTATSRAIVVEAVADEFTARVKARVDGLTLGPGMADPPTYLGPVITPEAKENILGFVARAKEGGATVLCGGTTPTDAALANGNYVSPTVLTDVTPEMPIAQEEVFGPVLAILRVPNFDAALKVANDVAYGLSASLFTRNLNNAMRFAREIEAGLVRVNGETAGVEPQAPFGGMKGSSSFSREQGQAAKEFYTQIKTIAFEPAAS